MTWTTCPACGAMHKAAPNTRCRRCESHRAQSVASDPRRATNDAVGSDGDLIRAANAAARRYEAEHPGMTLDDDGRPVPVPVRVRMDDVVTLHADPDRWIVTGNAIDCSRGRGCLPMITLARDGDRKTRMVEPCAIKSVLGRETP